MINPNYYLYIQTQSYKDLNLDPIIVHGDISGGNLMFSNVDENEIIAIIDWQLMHEGSPMEDLAQLLVHLCDGSTRRKIEEFIFEFYLKCLKKEFGNTKIPYTLNSIKQSYNYCFITQTFFVLMGILQKKIEDGNDEIAKAFYDSEVLKCLHALEDADRILQGELKEFYEKYNY
uniref:Aminoglycoside phosphotransferase domain-containing protein n=1 Tax=Panagrolaimus davidi TaxID=227884 RepID=A0A914QBP8_9BILA